MSTENSGVQDGTVRNWEAIARNVLAPKLRETGRDVKENMEQLADEVEKGSISEETIKENRVHVDMALLLIEENLGPTETGMIITQYETEEIDRGKFIGQQERDEL